LAFDQPIIETKRLVLRNWTDADCAALFEILRDAAVVRDVDDGKPFSLEKTRKFLEAMDKSVRENGFCRWKVVENASGELAGTCGFGRVAETGEIELGYLFARKHWGCGFAMEIAEAALDFGFNKLGFREIIAMTALENVASQRVLEKIGFTQRGLEVIGGEESLVYVKKKI
jgi:ribosomal-protein-alanine N-acetyltransferase